MLRAFVLGIYFIGCIVLGVAVSSASAGTEPMRTRSWKDAGSWEDERSEGEVRYDMNGRVVMTWQSRRRRTGAGAMLGARQAGERAAHRGGRGGGHVSGSGRAANKERARARKG